MSQQMDVVDTAAATGQPEEPPYDTHTIALLELAHDSFGVRGLQREGRVLRGEVPDEFVPRRDGAAAMSRLGYIAFVRPQLGVRTLILSPSKAALKNENSWRLPILLFFATVATTYYAGLNLAYPLEGAHAAWAALAFSASVLFILLSHEFGHWYVGRRNFMRATPPHLIPLPLLFGTMGAVIHLRSPAPDRDAMVKMGAAGPLAGLLATVIVLAIALPCSTVVSASSLHGDYIAFGEPLLMKAMSWLFGPHVPAGFEPVQSPAVLAGWFGMLITALNLLPGGQLDGGHVLRAFVSHRRQQGMTRVLAVLLLGLGWFSWVGWYVWAAIVFAFSYIGNPGPTDERPPLSRTAKWMAVLSLLAFIVCFCPAPLVEITL